MKTVIFLDVDGVINTSETKEKCCGYRGIDDEKVELLKRLIDGVEGEIVLSSTWREERNKKSELGKYLDDKLVKYGLHIADQTPIIQWHMRGLEIIEWLREHRDVEYIVILDDENFGYEHYGLKPYWINTQDANEWCRSWPGLTERDVEFVTDNIGCFNLAPAILEERE